MKKLIVVLSCLFLVFTLKSQTKVVCIGASITEGAGTSNPSVTSFPAQLQTLLGDGYTVENLGIGSRTMLRKGDNPYWNTPHFQKALQSSPDIVVIDLGGNDAKHQNRVFMNEMENDCIDMVKTFKNLSSNPRIILITPFASFEPDTMQISDRVILHQIIPRLRSAAYKENIEVLDMHPMFIERSDLMPDNIHPNDEGAAMIAKRLYDQIVLETESDFNLFANFKHTFVVSNFFGYECADFQLRGRECKVVKPKMAAKGKPWIWRSRFWAHEPQSEIALLERGYHLVYCDVSELMGNDEAIDIWSDFYQVLRDGGLSQKSALVGMSRGGMYVFNWAVANPDKVSAVYVDNPLLHCVYFADRFDEGVGEMVANFMDAYNLKTKEDLLNFKNDPMNNIDKIVAGGYPILIIYGDADEAVDPETQTVLFAKRVKEKGGDITLIRKKGFGHHPHSLPDPTPIVEFVLQSVK